MPSGRQGLVCVSFQYDKCPGVIGWLSISSFAYAILLEKDISF